MSATRRCGARSTVRRVLGALAVGALGLAPLVVPAGASAAAAAPPTAVPAALTTAVPASGVDVELEQVQPSALVPGSDLVVRVRVTNARTTSLDGARVRLFVNSPVLATRSEVASWAAGEGVQGGDRFVGVDGSELPLDVDLAPGASTEMTFDVQADQLRLGEEFGARGITVDVLDSSLQRLDALRSFVVWMPQGAPPASAGLTVLAPVVAGAPDTGTGQLPLDALEPEVTGDGRLARVIGSVTTPATSLVVDPAVLGPYARSAQDPTGSGATASPSSSGTPTGSASATTTEAPGATASPSTTGTLVAGDGGDAPAAVQSWRARLLALSPGGVVALPRGDTDVAGVVGAGTTGLLSLAVAQGTAAVTTAAGAPPAAGLVWPVAPVAASQLVLTASAAAQDGAAPAVVVDAAAVPGAVSAQGTSASTAQVQATGSDGSTSAPVRAVLVDRTDSSLLLSATQPATDGSAADPAEVGARLLADSAVAAAAGAGGQEQGLVLALPRTWDPDPVAASSVLSQLSSAPWVRSEPLTDLLSSDGATAGDPVTVGDDATPAAAEVSAVLPADGLITAQSAVDAVRRAGTLVDDPALLEQPVEIGAVAAASAGWADEQDAWRTQLAALAERREQLGGAVAVVSGSPLVVVNKVVSLPVTVRNDLSQNARVWVSVTSTSLRLQPGAAQEIVVPAGSTQVAYLPVRAVSSGDLTLYARLTDRAGQAVGGQVKVPVSVRADWESRGIAIAGVVVVLVFVGGVVRTVVRVRRRPAPPVVRTAEEADGDGPPARRPEESTRG